MPYVGKGAAILAKANAFTHPMSGTYLTCAKCGKRLGIKGASPAVKISKGVYVCMTCR